MICARCKREVREHNMSRFNTDEICLECEEKERQHPLYAYAKEVERQECLKGNLNFPGIGLPDDLK